MTSHPSPSSWAPWAGVGHVGSLVDRKRVRKWAPLRTSRPAERVVLLISSGGTACSRSEQAVTSEEESAETELKVEPWKERASALGLFYHLTKKSKMIRYNSLNV